MALKKPIACGLRGPQPTRGVIQGQQHQGQTIKNETGEITLWKFKSIIWILKLRGHCSRGGKLFLRKAPQRIVLRVMPIASGVLMTQTTTKNSCAECSRQVITPE
jgi:hypothetical protein